MNNARYVVTLQLKKTDYKNKNYNYNYLKSKQV